MTIRNLSKTMHNIVSRQKTLLFANPTAEKDGKHGNNGSSNPPASRTRPVMPPNIGFVDLRSNYDDTLFNRFYEEQMIPGFPDPNGPYLSV